MSIVQSLAGVLQPWADLYSGTTAVEATVVFLHIGSLLVAGGLALAMDRSIMRTARRDGGHAAVVVEEVAAAHSLVIGGLVVLIASGVAMLLADVESLLPSWVFWLKMVLFVLLLVNGALLRQGALHTAASDVDAAAARWRSLRAAAVRSTALWLLVTLLGTLLPLVV